MALAGRYFTRAIGKPRLDASTVILVEGTDDAYFLDEVLQIIEAPVTEVSVCIAEGKDNFSPLLQAILKSPQFTTGRIRRYAIIRDSDENLQNCNTECDKLFSIANEPRLQAGSFATRSDGRHNGLFLIPSSNQPGTLETLALSTLGPHPILQSASEFINTSVGFGGSIDHADKRRVQALLAALSNPLCNGVGWAARQGNFDLMSTSLEDLKNFLVELQTK